MGKHIEDHQHPIDSDDLHPGDKVSVDQIEFTTPGLVDVHKGKPSSAKYHAASIYVDYASRYTYIKCHYSTGAAKAIEGKQCYEQLAASHGVKIKAYRVDNGIMSCHDYVQHATLNQQSITYCGVNAHGQNGIAKRSIRTICEHARTISCMTWSTGQTLLQSTCGPLPSNWQWTYTMPPLALPADHPKRF